jgi:hypothetical protein
LVENLKQTNQLENLKINVRVAINLILLKQDIKVYTRFKWLKIEPSETSGFIMRKIF